MTSNYRIVKKILLLVCLTYAIKANAQNNDYLITSKGIGAIKLNMSQAELEKMLNQKFILRNALDTAVSFQDSATAKYKNISVLLTFQRHYTADNIYYMYLIGLKTTSPLCKTKKGIGIGADKVKLMAAYKANGATIFPECENEDCTKTSKTKYIINVNTKDESRITFYVTNKKVSAIEVATLFDDEE